MSVSRIMKDPVLYVILLVGRMLPDTIPADAFYLKMLYRHYLGKKLNLKSPVTYNEKMQWLKLYDRRPEYTMMVDKYEAKKYVSKILGDEYVIPTLGVWDRYEDIDFSQLPDQFVLKCTHDSGGLVICTDKSHFDQMAAKRQMNHALKRKYYKNTREWPYKNVKPRIIAETYMENRSSDNDEQADYNKLNCRKENSLVDYKFYTFNGKCHFLYVSKGLENHETANISFLTTEWEFAPFRRKDYAPFKTLPDRPVNFKKMFELSEELAKSIPFLRVDFYEINGQIYFGEFTFFPCSGFIPFSPEEYDEKIGRLLELSY